jgi:hypothetical protein
MNDTKAPYVKFALHTVVAHDLPQDVVDATIVPELRARIQASLDEYIAISGPRTVTWVGPDRSPVTHYSDDGPEGELNVTPTIDETKDRIFLMAKAVPQE